MLYEVYDMTNESLHKAKTAKNDEFYTRLTDVAEELRHYKKHFRGKTVLCNCDDPTWSAFWKYFHLNFEELGLKKCRTLHRGRELKYSEAAAASKLRCRIPRGCVS